MSIIKVAAANYPIMAFKTFNEWKANVDKWVMQAHVQRAQVILFPEYGSMELVSTLAPELQKDLKAQVRAISQYHGQILNLFQGLADDLGVTIVAPSFPVIESEERVVNRVSIHQKRRPTKFQDKQRMTRFEKNEWIIQKGNPETVTFEVDGVNFGVVICYDIEFPEPSRTLIKQGAEVLLIPSCTENWHGNHRVHIGARARSLENQCYTVVSQTVGEAKWSLALDHNVGQSSFYSPADNGFPADGILLQSKAQVPGWTFFDLDVQKIKDVRRSGQVLNFLDYPLHQ